MAAVSKPQPVTAEFRQQCHDLVDLMLNDHPGTSTFMCAIDGGTDTTSKRKTMGKLNAASIPPALSVMTGMVYRLSIEMRLLS